MNDIHTIEKLSAYIDGDLSSADKAALERELESDADLRSEYEAMLAAVDLLRTQGPLSAPVDLHRKVLAAVEAEPAPTVSLLDRLRGWFGGFPIESVAVAMAAVLVVVLIGQFGGEEDAEPAAESPDAVADAESPGEPSQMEGEVNAASATEDAVADAQPDAADAMAELIGGAWKEEAEPEAPKQKIAPSMQPEVASKDDDGVATLLDEGEAAGPEGARSAPDGMDLVEAKGMTPTTQDARLEAVLSAAPLSYQVRISSSDDLKAVLGLVSRHGGTARHAVTNARVTAKDAESSQRIPIAITLPQQNLSGFYAELSRTGLSVTTTSSDTNALSGSGSIQVNLDVVVE